jgi:ankyrin repeat protein
MLLEAGADVNLNDTDNESALMIALTGRSERAALPVMRALHEAGVDVNANAIHHHEQRTRGGTALHYAVRAGWSDAIDELASYGIDPNIKDPDGLTALDYAMDRGYLPFLYIRTAPRLDLREKLLAHGATVELAETPDWPPVGPPQGFDPKIWPLGPAFPSMDMSYLEPSDFLDAAIARLQYPGIGPADVASDLQ